MRFLFVSPPHNQIHHTAQVHVLVTITIGACTPSFKILKSRLHASSDVYKVNTLACIHSRWSARSVNYIRCNAQMTTFCQCGSHNYHSQQLPNLTSYFSSKTQINERMKLN